MTRRKVWLVLPLVALCAGQPQAEEVEVAVNSFNGYILESPASEFESLMPSNITAPNSFRTSRCTKSETNC